MNSFQSLIDTCELAIRQGQFIKAQDCLSSLKIDQIPRKNLSKIAELARRSGNWKLGLRILKPIIRPALANNSAPEPTEIVEYSLSLQRAGAMAEAKKLLALVDCDKCPQALLGLAFAEISEWNYEGALPFLNLLLNATTPGTYFHQVIGINRLACLAEIENASFDFLLEAGSLKSEIWKSDLPLLHSNFLEICSHYFVKNKKWEQAETALNEAQSILKNQTTIDSLFIQKWQAILKAYKNKDVTCLFSLRKQSLELGHWETLRDLDFYQGVIDPKSHWKNWVYYGTPYPAYRRRLEKFSAFDEENWVSRGTETLQDLDPWFSSHQDGSIHHRLIEFLLQDFYAPRRAGEIYGRLFEGDFYEFEASAMRVQQTIVRARRWIQEAGWPVKLIEREGNYSARIDENVRIKGRKVNLNSNQFAFVFGRFSKDLTNGLSLEEWSKLLRCSKSQTLRLVQGAQESGFLAKNGTGRYTTYKKS